MTAFFSRKGPFDKACDAFIRQLMHDVPVAQEYFF
jgi:hypothetical protein